MPVGSDTDKTPAAAAGPGPDGAGGSGARASLRGGRVVWLIVAGAVPQSVIAAKLLNGVIHPGGELPGIAFLIMLVFGIVWLAVVWGLVLLAALLRRPTLRLVVLGLVALPDLWCVPILVEDASFSLSHPTPDMETGWGYFDNKADRDLVVAIRACNPGLQRYGLVCDLDKVAGLARGTDVYAAGLAGDSQMSLALQNGPNPDVLRILLRAGKPPDEVLQSVFHDAIGMRDLALLRAVLEAGLDPNGLANSVNPVLFLTAFHGWDEGVAALLDAGAGIEQTDSGGYTVLMRAISERHYELAALLLARGAAEGRVAADGTSMATLVARIPVEDREKLPVAVVALVERHRAP